MIEMESDKTIKEKKLNEAALVIVDKVAILEVADQASKDRAVAFGQMIVTEIGAREDWFKPLKDQAWKLHKALCDKERAAVTQLKGAAETLGKKITDWNEEQDRLAEEARLKAEEEEREREAERQRVAAAKKKEEDRLLKEAQDREAEKQRKIKAAADAKAEEARKLKEAEAATASGDTDKAEQLTEEAADDGAAAEQFADEAAVDQQTADDLVDEAAESEASEPEPEPEPIQPTVDAPLKTKGGIEKKEYTAEVYDEVALINAVAAGKAPRRCIAVDQSYMNKLAVMNREDINDIPGVRLKTDKKQNFKKLKS